jgi:hypothetical protein
MKGIWDFIIGIVAISLLTYACILQEESFFASSQPQEPQSDYLVFSTDAGTSQF